jgi:O-antigen ligase
VGGYRLTPHAAGFLACAAVLLIGAVGFAHYSTLAFAVVGTLLLLSLGYACWHWPQPTLIALAVIPLFDRYVVSLMIPDELHLVARLFSEGLLLIAAVVIGTRSILEGRFMRAIRQPITIALGGFLALAIGSTLVNGVPVTNAALGIAFTIDAVVLFFLASMLDWRPAHLRAIAATLVIIATVAAVLAIAQVVLSPTILGLAASPGRFGEGHRVGAFFGGNPNMLGAMLAITAPFAFFGTVSLPQRRWRWASAGIGFLLVLALLFTFSRGAWFGLAGAAIITSLLFRPRVILVAAVTAVLAFGVANVLPRNLVTASGAADGGTDFIGSTFDRIDTIAEGNDLRVRFIDQGLAILADEPLLGVGPGQYGGAVAQAYGSSLYAELGPRAPARTVDNFWLHLVVEFGVLGTLAYLAIYLVAAIRPIAAAWRQSGERLVLLAGAMATTGVLALDSVTEMLLEGNTFSLPAWLLLGVAAAVRWPAADEPGPDLGRARRDRLELASADDLYHGSNDQA